MDSNKGTHVKRESNLGKKFQEKIKNKKKKLCEINMTSLHAHVTL